jgi:hypothetical protein
VSVESVVKDPRGNMSSYCRSVIRSRLDEKPLLIDGRSDLEDLGRYVDKVAVYSKDKIMEANILDYSPQCINRGLQ